MTDLTAPPRPPMRFAIEEGPLEFAGMTFWSAVLDDETPVISGTEFMKVMGIYRSGALSKRREDDEFWVPLHLAFKNLRSHIMEDPDLVEALRTPIQYRNLRGNVAEGIRGDVLRRICSVWVRARAAGVLGPSQEQIAAKAQLLLDALADVAINQLIYQATGYERRRAREDLKRILAAYISPELLPWVPRFPISFYQELYRVWGWEYDASSSARNAYVGKLTNKLIYDQLPPGVLQKLRIENPPDPITKRRRHKHHQLLTDDVGNPHLEKQILAVTTLLRATPTGKWAFFEDLFNNAFPPRQGRLFTDLEISQLPPPDKQVRDA